ncbi:aminotransferase IV [Rhodocytophaga rosea]|uniref:branched-chain-amino-acid transaminase n=1 Tax=Rhodocytophaga rosea TaxID=2704465 RepID=A0A6C0GMI0_9BACT|nr:aminotransferase class IV [Rhodocytophaga rosea]QHT69248.1 aminotransferase IV [Rhodocytophaga rosea]
MIVSCCINGEIVPGTQASIPVSDLGLLRGYAIFDFCRTAHGKPFLLEKHLVRFRRSAALMELPLNYTDEEITKLVYDTLEHSGLQEAGIRLLLTGGFTPDSFTFTEPTLIITAEHLALAPEKEVQTGVKLMSHTYLREMAEIKTTNYSEALRLRHQVKGQQAYDILYHHNGHILELTRSNFFIVKGQTIITPSDHILKGITRRTVLDLAATVYKVEERAVLWHELAEADEAFLTGTNKRLVPVAKVDDQQIGTGKPGKVTLHVYQLFREFEKNYQPGYSFA